MRVKYLLFVLLAGSVALLLGPSRGLTQFQRGGGRGGSSGGGGFRMDPKRIFDFMARGRDYIEISTMRGGRDQAEEWAKNNGVSNGRLTREQFSKYMEERMKSGGLGRGRGSRGGDSSRDRDNDDDDDDDDRDRNRDNDRDDDDDDDDDNDRDRGGDSRGDEMASRADSLFRRSDKDRDGLLNYDEMSETLRSERGKWDANNDGVVDATEYQEYIRAFYERREAERRDRDDDDDDDDDRDRGRDNRGGPPPGVSGSPPPSTAEIDKRPVIFRAGSLPSNIPGWFKDYDTNLDAQVALYEWKEKNGRIEDFVGIDRNEDGLVTVDEALRSVSSPGSGGNDRSSPSPGSSSGRNGYDRRQASADRRDRGGSQGGFPGGGFSRRGGQGGGFTPGGGGFPGGGFSRRGGQGGSSQGRGRSGGSDRYFNMMAQGKPTIVIADVRDSRSRERLTEWAKSNGVSNGELTREQFAKYMESSRSGGRDRRRGSSNNSNSSEQRGGFNRFRRGR